MKVSYEAFYASFFLISIISVLLFFVQSIIAYLGCYGIEGQFTVPTVGPADRNDFLTGLFDKARANIAAENDAFAPLKEQYEATMSEVHKTIEGITSLESANAAVASIPALNHALTSKKEASALLTEKVKTLGFVWDKSSKSYVEAKKETEEAM